MIENIDWSASVVDIHDELMELYFTKNPISDNVSDDKAESDYLKGEAWVEHMIRKYA